MTTRPTTESHLGIFAFLCVLMILPTPTRAEAEPTTLSPVADPSTVLEGEVTYPIDLATALILAQNDNLEIASARERIRQAAAQYRGARSLWLPSIRTGVTWGYHSGTLQESRGRVFNTDRYSLQAGAGAAAFGAGPPMLPGVAADFHLADALFLPLAARRQWASRQAASQAATNDTLLVVAVGYLDLLRAAQDQAIASDIEQKTKEIADLTLAYAKSGQGLESDADRMRAEWSLRQIETVRSEEGLAVTSARLAQSLRLDPAVQLAPTDLTASPLELTSSSQAVEDLTTLALSQRPELREHQNLVGEAQARLQRERLAPLVPTLSVGTSYGAFGGKEYGATERYDDRADVQAIAYWQVRNLGLGDAAAKQERRSLVTQAQYRCQAMRDLVKREVAEAVAQVHARRRQIPSAEASVAAAQASFDKNLTRIKGAQGLPIEVLQSLQALGQARREYLRVVTDLNVAQFHLQRATGQLLQATPTSPEAGQALPLP